MTFYILAFDPGKITGWCAMRLCADGIESWQPGQGDFEMVSRLLEHWDRHRQDQTVYVAESFIITPATGRNTQAPWSLEVIGLMRYFAARADVPFELQAPSSAKSLIGDDVLRSFGLWVKGQEHARDAIRHALYWAVTRGGRTDLLLPAAAASGIAQKSRS